MAQPETWKSGKWKLSQLCMTNWNAGFIESKDKTRIFSEKSIILIILGNFFF